MSEGITCYERDEVLCEEERCVRTGCQIRSVADALRQQMAETGSGFESIHEAFSLLAKAAIRVLR